MLARDTPRGAAGRWLRELSAPSGAAGRWLRELGAPRVLPVTGDLGEAGGELGGARGRSLQRRSGSVLH